MKKVITVILLLLSLCSIYSLSFATKCKKCLEVNNKSRHIGIAHRDFFTPNVHKDGKVYAVYKCEYGHKYLVELK